jgi:hypothetical protein
MKNTKKDILTNISKLFEVNRRKCIEGEPYMPGYVHNITQEEVLEKISNELILGLGSIENPEEIKKALINMYTAGYDKGKLSKWDVIW